MKRRAAKKLAAFLLTATMVFSLSGVMAFAAETGADDTAQVEVVESSTFTFTNQGEGETGTTSDIESTGETGSTDSTGSTSGTSSTSDSGSTGSTSNVKTADVNTGVYTVSAIAAMAALIALMGVTVSRRRRYGKEER